MSGIDMALDDQAGADDFKSDSGMPNIWTIDDDNDEDDRKHDEPKRDVVLSTDVEEELEKPSFLRRLAKRLQRKIPNLIKQIRTTISVLNNTPLNN
jgi:hypothetical protein